MRVFWAAVLTTTTLMIAGCPEGPGTVDAGAPDVEPEVDLSISTPLWAFRPWISKDISDGPDTYSFVDGFVTRDIPVGAVVLDSPWETNYNTFIPNEERYPNFKQMTDDLHADNIKLVLWVTQMINHESFDLEVGGDVYDEASPNLAEASQNDYLVDDAEVHFWWKGYGAGLDFFNPDAVDWWHAQQDHLLQEVGIDGWKLDFGEEYLPDVFETFAGEKTKQEYSELYYQDFFEYGRRVRGKQFVTMVRPYDQSYGFPGRFFARPEHAPVGWPGDQLRNDEGLADGLDHIFRSANAGYVVLGADIGGYLDNDSGSRIPFDLDNFHRWTAVSGMFPFFQLHGRANLEPWSVGADDMETQITVDLYRYWATLHDDMAAYWYAASERAYREERALLRPVGDGPEQWAGDYRFFVDDDFFVAPLLDGSGTRTVDLPTGQTYRSFWHPEEGIAEAGSITFTREEPLQIGVWWLGNAMVVMTPSNDATGFGSAASAGAATVVVNPTEGTRSIVVPREVDEAVADDASLSMTTADGTTTIELSGFGSEAIIVAFQDEAPADVVTIGDAMAPAVASAEEVRASSVAASFYDANAHTLWVKVPSGTASVTF